jgi:hypothetical protein
MVCVLGFFVRFLSETAIIVLNESVIITFGPILSFVGVSSFLSFAPPIQRRIRLLLLSWIRVCESSYGVRIYLSISGLFPRGNVDCWILVQLHIVRNHVVHGDFFFPHIYLQRA